MPESRALAIQPRTLEVLAGLGVTDRLVVAGNRSTTLCSDSTAGSCAWSRTQVSWPTSTHPSASTRAGRSLYAQHRSWCSSKERSAGSATPVRSWRGVALLRVIISKIETRAHR
ncbi:MAG: hypothetical protein ACRD0W_03165 [Acidimicrobiales bacterium]